MPSKYPAALEDLIDMLREAKEFLAQNEVWRHAIWGMDHPLHKNGVIKFSDLIEVHDTYPSSAKLAEVKADSLHKDLVDKHFDYDLTVNITYHTFILLLERLQTVDKAVNPQAALESIAKDLKVTVNGENPLSDEVIQLAVAQIEGRPRASRQRADDFRRVQQLKAAERKGVEAQDKRAQTKEATSFTKSLGANTTAKAGAESSRNVANKRVDDLSKVVKAGEKAQSRRKPGQK